MPQRLIDVFDWVARAGGIIAVLAAVFGYLLREKWKQMLQLSLGHDMERIKHEFERDLAAYKVSLIAEAEADKAKQDLKKSIALRYAEIEFERLIELEQIASSVASDISSYAIIEIQIKTEEQLSLALDKMTHLSGAFDRAGAFLALEDQSKINELRWRLLEI